MTDTISVEALLAILVAIATVLSKVLDKFLDFVYKLVMAKTNSGKVNPAAVGTNLAKMGNEVHSLTVWHEYEGKMMLKALNNISEQASTQTEVLRGLLSRMKDTERVARRIEDHMRE